MTTRDLTGHIFTRLTVLRDSGNRQYGEVMWLCHCSCGETKEVRVTSLTAGRTKSCGCLQREGARARGISQKRKRFGTRRQLNMAVPMSDFDEMGT